MFVRIELAKPTDLGFISYWIFKLKRKVFIVT